MGGSRWFGRRTALIVLACICTGLTSLVLGPLSAAARRTPPKQACIAASKSLCAALRKAVDKEIAAFVKSHRKQLAGPVGPRGATGATGAPGPATGPAGGALSGTYPNPSLNVTGGPCPNGKSLINVSSLAALTCGNGVYSDSSGNVAAGASPFAALTSGANNTAFGFSALNGDSTASFNTAFGSGALPQSNAGLNTAVGFDALNFDVTGIGNSAFGSSALADNISGSGNTAVGHSAGQGIQSTSNNTAIGSGALVLNSIGASNTAVGASSLLNNTSGSFNTAVGTAALGDQGLPTSANASNNDAFGYQALRSIAHFTGIDGFFDNAFGRDALTANTTGFENDAFGDEALFNVSTGHNDTAIGDSAGINLSTESNNLDIVNNGQAADSGVTRIGTPGNQTSAFIAGIRNVTTGQNNAVPVVVDSNGQLGTASSSRRFKTDIRPIGAGADRLMQLRPVSFHYKKYAHNPNDRVQYGLIAEEVARVYPQLVVDGPDRKPITIMYQELPALLLAELQRQQRQIDRLETEVAALTRR